MIGVEEGEMQDARGVGLIQAELKRCAGYEGNPNTADSSAISSLVSSAVSLAVGKRDARQVAFAPLANILRGEVVLLHPPRLLLWQNKKKVLCGYIKCFIFYILTHCSDSLHFFRKK